MGSHAGWSGKTDELPQSRVYRGLGFEFQSLPSGSPSPPTKQAFRQFLFCVLHIWEQPDERRPGQAAAGLVLLLTTVGGPRNWSMTCSRGTSEAGNPEEQFPLAPMPTSSDVENVPSLQLKAPRARDTVGQGGKRLRRGTKEAWARSSWSQLSPEPVRLHLNTLTCWHHVVQYHRKILCSNKLAKCPARQQSLP